MAKKKVKTVESEAMDAELMDTDFVPETSPALVVKDEIKKSGYSSDDLRKRTLELVFNIKENYLELAMCLYEINVGGKFKSYGHETFKKYAQDELGVKYSKALYLKNIWLHFGSDEQLLKKIESVGWDKMKEITRIANSENVEGWVAKAQHLSADALKGEVKTALKNLVPDNSKDLLEKEGEVRGTAAEDQLFPMTFQFMYSSKATVLTAIEKVQKETGASTSESLALICADYSGSANDGDGINHVLNLIHKYEKILNLKFVVIDGDAIVHGKQILEDLTAIAIRAQSVLNG